MREAETKEAAAGLVGGEAGAEALMEVAGVATITGAIEGDLTGAMTETMAGVPLGVAAAEEAGGTQLLTLPAEAEATTADITVAEDTETITGPRILVITVQEVLAAAQ